MSAFDVYVTYLAVKAHFTRKNYDYFRYAGRVKASEEKFQKRNDRYFFEKLSRKMNKEEIEQYFVSNFLATSNFWIGYMEDKHYLEWLKKSQSITYLFDADLHKSLSRSGTLDEAFRCKNKNHSLLLKMYLSGQVMLETLVLLNRITSFAYRYDEILSHDVIWNQISGVVKRYDPFLRVETTKIKKVILQKV